jgi:DNA adenine methylase
MDDIALQTRWKADPFLKWPGGKRWAASHIAGAVRRRLENKYFEPFLGGGAVFFCLCPRRALLSDINGDLINIYRMIRDHPNEVIEKLRVLPVSRAEYYRIRASEPSEPALRAARFLYLNRTAFGGMYRLNRAGKFNVPYGGGEREPSVLWQRDILKEASAALKNAELREADFETALEQAGPGDVVYCDPTYTVTHDQDGFVRYNNRNFSWADQERLAKAASRASRRNATIMISNAHHREIRRLYRTATFETLARFSTLCPDPSRRRTVLEYLITL